LLQGLCNGLGIRLEGRVLSTEIENARTRYLVQVRVDLDPSRAEYARRRSSILDPGFSGTVRNIQEPSTLGGDRVLSIPVSREWFGISKSRVRSAEIFRSRYLGNGSECPRAENARRRSSTLDPGFSGTVRNIQEPSTLGGDFSIPVSRKRFGMSKSRVRSAEIEYSRSRDL